MDKQKLETIAQFLVQAEKGILAADESQGTIKKRFDAIQVDSTEETRKNYRELLFTTNQIEKYISGVILFDETIRQAANSGIPFAKLLADKEIYPGIKVDLGAKELANSGGEKVTEGLDGLRQRLFAYRDLGAKFAKWRAVIIIADQKPSWLGIQANAHALARYAALCQEADIVPIVEPEVLMDGTHDINRCREATAATLQAVFAALFEHCVLLEATLLKPNMVISGKENPVQASPEQVAQATISCFRQVVPAAVPGIVFLSGGQSPEQATENLNAINSIGHSPWQLSFSFGRALQEKSLQTWQGRKENCQAAQEVFLQRAWLNSAARSGKYARKMEAASPIGH